MGQDFIPIFTWWLLLLLFGLIFLPTAVVFFNNFWDRGYIFAKIGSILFLSYTIWILGSLKLISFTPGTIVLLLILALIANSILAYRLKLFPLIENSSRAIFLEEIIFVVGLVFWSFVRAHEPSIHGLEKFMDFGFINSILRSQYFPPVDLWMTPYTINYYYFGHLVTAVIIKASGLDPSLGYNLMVATLFALTLAASFALGANLFYFFIKNRANPSQEGFWQRRQIIIAGFLSAFLAALGGNLHTIYIFFKTYTPADNPVPFWQLPAMFNPLGYWYPNATRFIPNTIHEFPIYSFVVSDLHGHVLGIPFVLLFLAILLRLFRFEKISPYFYPLLGLFIGVFLMTNVLDGPIYLLLIFIFLLAKSLRSSNLVSSLQNALIGAGAVTILAMAFSLPFWLAFKPFASGIGVLCAPNFLINLKHLGPFIFEADHCARSPLWMSAILWGFFYFTVIGFLIFVVKDHLKNFFKMGSSDFLVIVLAIFATILLIIPEFLYVKDIYPVHYRANTLFKFGYQAFIVLSVAGGYIITRIFSQGSVTRFFKTALVLLFGLVAIYPYFAINSYYDGLKNYHGLNGMQYLADLYPTDYQAIIWLRDNISGQPVILEAQGDSYTDYARVSANTGLPTVIGWPVHEWLWRGTYDEAGKRSSDVSTLYESPDLTLTKDLLKKYKVAYVFIGSLEKQKYTNLNEAKFAQLGQVIFQDGETKVYQLTP